MASEGGLLPGRRGRKQKIGSRGARQSPRPRAAHEIFTVGTFLTGDKPVRPQPHHTNNVPKASRNRIPNPPNTNEAHESCDHFDIWVHRAQKIIGFSKYY